MYALAKKGIKAILTILVVLPPTVSNYVLLCNLIDQIQYDKPNPFSLSNFKKPESAVAIKPTTALTANARSRTDDAHDRYNSTIDSGDVHNKRPSAKPPLSPQR